MRNRPLRVALFLGALLVLVPASPAGAQFDGPDLPGGGDPPANLPKVTARAVASHLRVKPGERFTVAVVLQVAEGLKFYAPYPGPNKDLIPARIVGRAGAKEIDPDASPWPPYHPYNDAGGIITNVYSGRLVAFVPVTVPADAAPSKWTVRLAVDGQTCSKTECIPLPDTTGPDAVSAEASVQIGPGSTPNPAWADKAISGGLGEARTPTEMKAAAAGKASTTAPASGDSPESETPEAVAGLANLSTWQWLGLALLAGLTLNIMPCVLPVIPIRILSIVEMGKESRRRIVILGLAFAAGVLLFFVGFAAFSAALKAATGRVIDIGAYFGQPAFHITMGAVMVALAANLMGAFEIVVPSRIAGISGRKGGGVLSSMGMGVMMAVLATPCSFAYLAGALAWAQTQTLWLGSLAIVLIGVGMAAPHALLVAWPDLLKKMPKPGLWMDTFKKSMGFVLLLVAVWLFGSMAKETYAFWAAAWGVVLAYSLWMWGSWLRYDAPLRKKLLVRGAALAIAVGAGLWMLPVPVEVVHFEDYQPGRVEELRGQNHLVLVKFTASWCLKCKALDKSVYQQKDVARELDKRKVKAVKVDVSRRGGVADKYMTETFRGQPPLTVIYPANGGKPTLLRGSYSKAELLKALDAAGAVTPGG